MRKLLNADESDVLVAVLAGVDVVFMPHRRMQPLAIDTMGAALGQLRRRYETCGVPITIGGDGRQRQAGFRGLNALVSKVMITLHKVKGVRRQVKLTNYGDAAARSLCGLPTAYDGFHLLCGELCDAFERHGSNCGFVHERHLNATVEQLLPLMVRGWVVTNCDSSGSVGYALADLAGVDDEIEQPPVRVRFEIEAEPKLPRRSKLCEAKYRELLAAGLEARKTWKPEYPPSDIHIALSSGLWPWPVKPAETP